MTILINHKQPIIKAKQRHVCDVLTTELFTHNGELHLKITDQNAVKLRTGERITYSGNTLVTCCTGHLDWWEQQES